jgi:hypothetical protein
MKEELRLIQEQNKVVSKQIKKAMEELLIKNPKLTKQELEIIIKNQGFFLYGISIGFVISGMWEAIKRQQKKEKEIK